MKHGKIRLAAFRNFADCLASFAVTSGSVVQGKADPEDFARALQDSGKYGINPTTGGKVPGYVHGLAATIRGIGTIVARRRP